MAESEKFEEEEVSGLSISDGSEWGSGSERGSDSGISSDLEETGDATKADPFDVVRDRESSHALTMFSSSILKTILTLQFD